ncbi:hypothetical protein [Archangium violaceum]|uniref:hypothetical protein n=1 Tax=Archangium violaceum TaxID=83451 RepID=UPI0007C7463C|nr:hypothetical protein [Archangium violaceum]
MSAAKRLTTCLLGSLLLGMGCAPARPIEGVWRPGFGEDPDRIPGPMRNFGPFDSYTDAILAACPLILSKPNATVGYLQDVNPELAKRVATEYCAWLYYTPEHRYEMSMLTDLSKLDDLVTHKKSCLLPTFVNDLRYERGELKYIFALHNHPFGSVISDPDMAFIEEMASIHEWVIKTKNNGELLLSIIAFFSMSQDPALATCDGFYQYVPATRSMVLWTQTQGRWKQEVLEPAVWQKQKRARQLQLRNVP